MEGKQCEQCNGAMCAFCQFNKIVTDGSKAFKNH